MEGPMKRLLYTLYIGLILVIVYLICSFLISDPQVTCVEAGGAFRELDQTCQGLESAPAFLKILERETKFLIALSSTMTLIFFQLGIFLNKYFSSKKQ
jgi:uncharacterized membrane protein (DUF485 family)